MALFLLFAFWIDSRWDEMLLWLLCDVGLRTRSNSLMPLPRRQRHHHVRGPNNRSLVEI